MSEAVGRQAGKLESPQPFELRDVRGRALRDLRISVTDRCNFRCSYCMPRSVFGPGFRFLPAEEILSFEEIARVARVFVSLGVHKLRLTGGEPLLRRDLPQLIRLLPQGPELDLALTTNGSLDDAVFQHMNDAQVPVREVLHGIERAATAGLEVKINAVIRRGVNDAGLLDLVRHFKGSGQILRLIEFMDVGTTNGWERAEVVSAREMLESIHGVFPLEPAAPNYAGEVAQRYRFSDGSGELGIIASVTQPFCGDCSRGRLSATGSFYTCLFASDGHDLRALLRGGASDQELHASIAARWHARRDAYSELRGRPLQLGHRPKIEMSFIGG